MGQAVLVIGPTIHQDTFALGEQTTIADHRPYEDGAFYWVCPIDGWGFVWFPSESLQPREEPPR